MRTVIWASVVEWKGPTGVLGVMGSRLFWPSPWPRLSSPSLCLIALSSPPPCFASLDASCRSCWLSLISFCVSVSLFFQLLSLSLSITLISCDNTLRCGCAGAVLETGQAIQVLTLSCLFLFTSASVRHCTYVSILYDISIALARLFVPFFLYVLRCATAAGTAPVSEKLSFIGILYMFPQQRRCPKHWSQSSGWLQGDYWRKLNIPKLLLCLLLHHTTSEPTSPYRALIHLGGSTRDSGSAKAQYEDCIIIVLGK